MDLEDHNSQILSIDPLDKSSLSNPHVFSTLSEDGQLFVWDLREKKPVLQFSDPKLSESGEVGWTTSNGTMIVVSGDMSLYFFDFIGKNEPRKAMKSCLLTPPPQSNPEETAITCLKYENLSQDLIVTDDEGHLYLVDHEKLSQKATLPNLHTQVNPAKLDIPSFNCFTGTP